MDHLLVVLVLLWSSGLQAEGNHNSIGAQCETTEKADIIVLVDSSGSISPTGFENIKKFVSTLVNAFNIGPDRVQIGLTKFSDISITEWNLNTHQTKDSLLDAVFNLQHIGGGTKTGHALDFVLHNNFKPNAGMREDSQKIVVLITDGRSTDHVRTPSQNLKDMGVEIYVIGVDDFSIEEGTVIASEPKEFHTYYISDFKYLQGVIESFTVSLCNSVKNLEPVRLKGGHSRCAGRLEVKHGEWRPVGDSTWTLKEAAVVCRQLDCGSAVSTGSRNMSSVTHVWWINSDCVQSGHVLRECLSSGSSSFILEITCSDSVRLVNGTSLCSGRLEVKFDQLNQSSQFSQWSSVCEADFDQQEAEVVCRQLGCGAPSLLQGGLYGEVEAPMWSREFQCEGNESALLDCRSSDSGTTTCSPGTAVGLTCSEPVRLEGGHSRCAGRLEVKHQGKWRPVNNTVLTLEEAAVVCKELDCGSAVSTGSRNMSSVTHVWWISSDCGSALRECATLSVSSSIVELICSDLLVQPIISVDGAKQQENPAVLRGSSFTVSCSIQPQYPGGSFQLILTSSYTAHNYNQPAVNHSAHFWFPAAEPAHQGNYTCVYHVYVFSHNFSSDSRRLCLSVADPTVFIIRLVVLLLSLLVFTSVICFTHKTTRGQKPGPQEKTGLDYSNLGVCRAEEEGAQTSE